jgi:hypothetical protein
MDGQPPVPRPSFWSRWLARSVHATLLVDRTYVALDRLRSKFVLAVAPDSFFDEYNNLAYGRRAGYRPDDRGARQGLFDWEREAIARTFPPAPARVLVGGAGGGREALALARMGYRVVAFDPARPLVEAMAAAHVDGPAVEALAGRYEDLPHLATVGSPPRPVDLGARPAFDAAVAGWGSLSHLRSDERRTATLRRLGELTAGPILVSYIPQPTWVPDEPGAGGTFSPQIGYFRNLSADDVKRGAEAAGLEVIVLEHNDTHSYAVLRRIEPRDRD